MGYKDADKQRIYAREWVSNRRKTWLEANGPCARCGSWEDLEVDHIDPEIKISHNVWSWTEKRRLEELAKCQVLCKTCHLEKTSKDRRHKVEHGSVVMYTQVGCRCDACRAGKAERDKIFRDRRKTK